VPPVGSVPPFASPEVPPVFVVPPPPLPPVPVPLTAPLPPLVVPPPLSELKKFVSSDPEHDKTKINGPSHRSFPSACACRRSKTGMS
jgi:hypothetical protein